MIIGRDFNLATSQTHVFDAVVLQHRGDLERATTQAELEEIANTVISLFPDELRQQIEDYRNGDTHILSIKGSQVAANDKSTPPTPSGSVTSESTQHLLYYAALGLINGLVRTPALRDRDGMMQINHVIPRSRVGEFEVESTDVDLSFHTDGMRRRRIPGSINLYCIRPQEGAETYFISNESITSNLDPETLEVLSQPLFSFDNAISNIIEQGDAFGTRHEHTIDLPYAIVDDGVLRYSQRSSGTTAESVAALKKLREVMAMQGRYSVTLRQGDITLFRNDRVLHGRSTFPFLEDTSDRRWVLRQTSDSGPEMLAEV